MNNDTLVRRWVMTFPGMFEGENVTSCYRAAYAKAGLSSTMAVSEFAAALNRMGYTPRVVRARYRLVLPEAGPGVTSRGFRS